MSGQCYSCATNFSRFNKEKGCKNCGYAFCKTCLSKRARIPKLKNEEHKVCLSCYNCLTGTGKPVPVNFSPPEALAKRLAALENDAQTKESSADIVAGSSGVLRSKSSNYRGMTKQDIEIAKRLEALKKDKAPPPTVDSMEKRLAILKGQNPELAVQKGSLPPPDRRGQQEQVDDLLQQICDEVEIDNICLPRLDSPAVMPTLVAGKPTISDNPLLNNNLNKTTGNKQHINYVKNIGGNDDDAAALIDPKQIERLINQVSQELHMDSARALAGLRKDKELHQRLAQLKGTSSSSSENIQTTTNFDEDEEQQAKLIIKQLLNESRLEEDTMKLNLPNIPDGRATCSKSNLCEEEDELPWCCICNANATLRCEGCDGDLYCRRCYKEGHERSDYADHTTTEYKAKQSQ